MGKVMVWCICPRDCPFLPSFCHVSTALILPTLMTHWKKTYETYNGIRGIEFFYGSSMIQEMPAGRWKWRARPKGPVFGRIHTLPEATVPAHTKGNFMFKTWECGQPIGEQKRPSQSPRVAPLGHDPLASSQVRGDMKEAFYDFWCAKGGTMHHTEIPLDVTGSPGSSPSRHGPASPSSSRPPKDSTSARFQGL